MNKFKTFTALMLLLAIGFAGCGKSEAERHRLSKKEKARLDSLDPVSYTHLDVYKRQGYASLGGSKQEGECC